MGDKDCPGSRPARPGAAGHPARSCSCVPKGNVSWSLISARKQEGHAKTETQVIRPPFRTVGPIPHSGLKAHGLTVDVYQACSDQVDRNRPGLGFPVIDRFRTCRERDRRGRRVGQEWLQEALVDVTAIMFSGEGPDVVEQRPIGEWSVD